MIRYQTTLNEITASQLTGGFFDGWPNPPSAETHLKILRNSHNIVLAIDIETSQVVGFINAISDGILSAYIPLLEVVPAYKGRGVGSTLVQHMIADTKHLYMVDLLCDDTLRPFYEQLGMHPAGGMILRNYSRQSGA